MTVDILLYHDVMANIYKLLSVEDDRFRTIKRLRSWVKDSKNLALHILELVVIIQVYSV